MSGKQSFTKALKKYQATLGKASPSNEAVEQSLDSGHVPEDKLGDLLAIVSRENSRKKEEERLKKEKAEKERVENDIKEKEEKKKEKEERVEREKLEKEKEAKKKEEDNKKKKEYEKKIKEEEVRKEGEVIRETPNVADSTSLPIAETKFE
uniref:Uncharacterized protein n=1 Tax=Cucumis melo TaxID=3656 RepID=A0A9I9DI26_CUCME